MIRFAIALLVGGAVLTFFGYSEHQLASSADAKPQSITVADLVANGYGDNANVQLTDYWLLDSQSVIEYPEGNESTYNKIWAPVITADDPYVQTYMNSDPNQPPPAYGDKVGIILYSKEINNDNEFRSAMAAGSIKGLVINQIDKISGEELKLLKQGVPGIDPDKVLVIEHNRKPKSTSTTMLMMVGGVLLMLAGPGLFVLGRNK